MKLDARFFAILTGLAVFVGLPMLFYAMGDAPRRSLLKEVISVATFLSFGFMIGQFFLARSNTALAGLFKPLTVQKVHKYIAYSAVAVIALHPFMIVFPRYFEGGVKPLDAFWTMITSFDNLGIVLGLIAWGLMLVLGVTAFLRMRLLKRFATRYRGWRYFHGSLAVVFTVLAAWHAIDLGRHIHTAMTAYFIALIFIGFGLLARLYWSAVPRAPAAQPLSEGVQS
ncbi:ferric reductase-like transmembrane domain-containing protein [Thioclava sp.]|uniref:ferric reductase-like transmembrane domain-containing protein n=1 Tax=Thioclava sp. TaxID=1933450 RepID=UPI003AA82511